MNNTEKNTTGSERPRHPPAPGGPEANNSAALFEQAQADGQTAVNKLGSRLEGLDQAEASSRLKQIGLNEFAREKRPSALRRLLANIKNPLVLLLLALGEKPEKPRSRGRRLVFRAGSVGKPGTEVGFRGWFSDSLADFQTLIGDIQGVNRPSLCGCSLAGTPFP